MAKLVYAKSGDKLVKKWRCTSGKRRGKIVSSPENCFKPIDIKKRARMKKLRRMKNAQMTRKAQITKKVNPVSRQVSKLNDLLKEHIERDKNER